MAMTLRLADEEIEALRTQAAKEGRSMHEVVRSAIRQYVVRQGHEGLVDGELKYVVEKYADALRRLGE